MVPDDGVGPLAAESRGEVLCGGAAQGDERGCGGGAPDGLGEEAPRHPVRAGEIDGLWAGGTCAYDVSAYLAMKSLGSVA